MTTTAKLGNGPFQYEVLINWETLPTGYSWPEVASVAVDSDENVYVFNRGEHPMMVFDRNGNFLRSWGEGVFVRPHGLSLGPNDTLYCTDDGDHTVRQCNSFGKILMTIGTPGKATKPHGGSPFNRCTHVAVCPRKGDLYISDGYGNSRVHKFTPDGQLLFSWGAPGTGPGEFNIPHNIATDKDGYVYVADRENHRIQIFTPEGNYENQWTNMHRPAALFFTAEQHLFVGELGAGMPVNRSVPNIGPRITVYDRNGKKLATIGHLGYGLGIGQFVAPHGICLDSKGDIYLAEVAKTNLSQFQKPPSQIRSLQKLIRIK